METIPITEKIPITQPEVTAQVFQIIRSYEGPSAKTLWQIIQRSMPDIPVEMLKKAVKKIKEKIDD